MSSSKWIILQLFQLICAEELPVIQISTNGVPSFDFQNESVTVLTNSNPEFQMLCTASYPVEWIFHFSENDDGNTERNRLIETRRRVTNFSDVSSYSYSSNLKMEYKGKVLSPTNMTCQGVSSSNQSQLARHVIMTLPKQTSIVELEITSELGIEKHLHEWPFVNENCTEAKTLILHPSSEYPMPCWKCQAPENNIELDVQFEFCYSPTKCASLYKKLNHGKQCSKLVDSAPGNCWISDADYNPKQILCRRFGPILVQTYFFGVLRGNLSDQDVAAPNIYLDWTEADPQDMLYAHPLVKEVFYTDHEVTFTCEYSRYYFALGSWFGFESENTMEYIPAVDIRPCDTEKEKHRGHAIHTNCTSEDFWRGTYKASLTRTLEKTGAHRIFCFGPVWNSTEWINQSLAFRVEQGEAPKVLSVDPGTTTTFRLGQQFRKLVCKFTGSPIPEIQWTLPTNHTHCTINSPDNYTSELIFTEIGYISAGKYICTAISCKGIDSRSYILPIEHIHDSVLAIGHLLPYLVGSVFCVLVLISTGFLLCYRKALREQKLRILTDSEINEFVHGDPQFLEVIKDDYFTRHSSLNALPYDPKYEIAIESLKIYQDYLLGSGEFGSVFKGKLRSSCVPQYLRFSESDSTPYTDILGDLVVAIKISKGDLDVVKFKALLTEIKVMAYLGSHSNIVSLIGASTKNIRNRELCIAVEYCENGSLDVYLRSCKDTSSFQSIDDDQGSDVGATVTDLLQWACQIATGLEYIHSKKIVHGDMAIRNILLTKNFIAKIGDFGLSRQLVDTSIYTKKTNCPLPWRNMAVESLSALEFSVKSDIWAFGVTLWELFTLGDVPYPGLNYTPEFANLLERGLRLYKPPLASNTMYNYMLKCWNIEPSLRPEPGEIISCCYELLQE